MPTRKQKRVERKPIPTFATEGQERKFWETHDTTDYVDWRHARRATFPNLKPHGARIELAAR